MFDKSDKNNATFVEYMKDKRCLILEQAKMVRSSVSHALQGLGVLHANINSFDNVADALQYLREHKTDLIVASDALTGQGGGDFYRYFCEQSDSRLNSSYFMMSQRSSPSLSLQVAIKEIDGLIIRPFTMESLQKIFVEVLTPKISPDSYTKLLDDAKTHLLKKELSLAQEKLEKCISINKRPLSALYYLGVGHRFQGDLDQAQYYFRQALEIDPIHYRSLESLYELAMEARDSERAYEIVEKMVAHYPVDASRLPEFTKLLIMNQRFNELINLCQVFDVEEDFSESARLSAAAGLALVGKHLGLKEMKEDGLRILEKALTLAHGRSRILINIANTLIMLQEYSRAEKVLDSLSPKDQEDNEALIVKLEVLDSSGAADTTLSFANKLVARKIKTQRVYEIMIKNAFKVGRNPQSLNDLVQEASYLYPERKSYFQAFLKHSR